VITILKKNGWTLPVGNLDKATTKITGALQLADEMVQKNGQRADLRRASNQWSFYGGVLRQGADMGVTNLNLGFGYRVFVGAGDAFAQAVNLDLTDANGLVVQQDRKYNAVAALDYFPNGGAYGVRVYNARATGPAVVIMAVLDVYPAR